MGSVEKQSIPTPISVPRLIHLSWIDTDKDISVQVQRKAGNAFYDAASKTFKPEAQCSNSGLVPMVRDTGLRAAYQALDILTPDATFPEGAYTVYYYDQTFTLLHSADFYMYQGIPFDGYGFPYFGLIPSAGDVAVATVVKLMDNTTVSLHRKPDTPGMAFNNMMSPACCGSFMISGPPTAVKGSAVQLSVQVVDINGNPFPTYVGTACFISSDPLAVLPKDYSFVATDAGKHTFTVTFKTAGTQTVTMTDLMHSAITGSVSVDVS